MDIQGSSSGSPSEGQNPTREGEREVPRGVGVVFGICLGAGLSLTQNPVVGICVGFVFAVAMELGFARGRTKQGAWPSALNPNP